jgi:hypothetical protein
MSRMTGVLNRFGATLNCDSRKRILNAFVMPKMLFCLPVWCHINKSTEKAMDRMLLVTSRIVLRNKNSVLGRLTCASSGILPFASLSAFRCLLTVHSLLGNDTADYLPKLLSDPCSQRNTRSTEGRKCVIPRHSKTSDEQCFYYSAAKLWNSVPSQLTIVIDKNKFYNQSFNYMLTQLSD